MKLAGAMKRGLEAEGFAVDIVGDGTEGLWAAREGAYDLLVLDVMLPGTDGYQVCKTLREAEDWTPVLVLTARNERADELRAFAAGADDYLAKPFSFMVLVARIRSLLRRGVRVQPANLEAGSLRLDVAGHRCFRGETEVMLTAREFAILQFLMTRTGEAVSKLTILDNVWDFAFEGDPNIVEVYIRRLRQKVDEPFHLTTIQTVRGSGYRVDADGR